MDPYEILNIGITADKEEIEEAYHRKKTKYCLQTPRTLDEKQRLREYCRSLDVAYEKAMDILRTHSRANVPTYEAMQNSLNEDIRIAAILELRRNDPPHYQKESNAAYEERLRTRLEQTKENAIRARKNLDRAENDFDAVASEVGTAWGAYYGTKEAEPTPYIPSGVSPRFHFATNKREKDRQLQQMGPKLNERLSRKVAAQNRLNATRRASKIKNRKTELAQGNLEMAIHQRERKAAAMEVQFQDRKRKAIAYFTKAGREDFLEILRSGPKMEQVSLVNATHGILTYLNELESIRKSKSITGMNLRGKLSDGGYPGVAQAITSSLRMCGSRYCSDPKHPLIMPVVKETHMSASGPICIWWHELHFMRRNWWSLDKLE